MYFQVEPTRRNITQYNYYCETLYMFQAGPPPIVRSSKLYTQHRVYVRLYYYLLLSWKTLPWQRQVVAKPDIYPMLCIQFRAPDDGRRTRLKHVERFTVIIILRNVASCWFYLKIHEDVSNWNIHHSVFRQTLVWRTCHLEQSETRTWGFGNERKMAPSMALMTDYAKTHVMKQKEAQMLNHYLSEHNQNIYLLHRMTCFDTSQVFLRFTIGL
jgi:hypothetical protein